MKRVITVLLAMLLALVPARGVSAEVKLLAFGDLLYWGFTEDDKPHGYGALTTFGEGTYYGMFKDGAQNGFGVMKYPNAPEGSVIFVAGNFTDGRPDGVFLRLFNDERNSCNRVIMDSDMGTELIADYTGIFEYAKFKIEEAGLEYEGMVLAGTEIPFGYGIYYDNITEDRFVGNFMHGIPVGIGIQANFEEEGWIFGLWNEYGNLDEANASGGNKGDDFLYSAFSGRHSNITEFWGGMGGPEVEPPFITPVQVPAQSGLLTVSYPPSEFLACTVCDGSGRIPCRICLGTGRSNIPGSACFGCFGRTTDLCYACRRGVSFAKNTAYDDYIVNLGILTLETGMSVFALEGGPEKYIAIQECVYCNGDIIRDGFICMSCRHGFHIIFLNSPNDNFVPPPRQFSQLGRNTNEDLIKYYRGRIKEAASTPSVVATNARAACLNNCGNARMTTSVYCSSCSAGRGAIDLGVQSTGNCTICGRRVYGASATCGAH